MVALSAFLLKYVRCTFKGVGDATTSVFCSAVQSSGAAISQTNWVGALNFRHVQRTYDRYSRR